MQTTKRELQVTPGTEHEEVIRNISNDEIIQKLSRECRDALTQMVAENGDADFILGAIAEVEKAGPLSTEAIANHLSELLGSLELELSVTRTRRFAARVAAASEDSIIMALAESCHEALNEIAAESVVEYFVAVGLALAAKHGEETNEAVAAALHTRLVSFTETIAEIREYRESWEI